MKSKSKTHRHPSPAESGGQAQWFGSAGLKFDSVEVQSPNLSKIEGIKNRIQQGFYDQKQIDNDLSDKLAKAFFDLDLDE